MRRLLVYAFFVFIALAIWTHLRAAEGATDFFGILAFVAIALLCIDALIDNRDRHPRIMYLTQEDLATHIAYANRTSFIANGLSDGGAFVEVIGFASKVIDAPPVGRIFVGKGAAGRSMSVAYALFRAIASHADAVAITSVGALYHGLLAWVFRFLGLSVIYDCHDPTIETITLIAGDDARVKLATRWIGLMDRLMGLASLVTIVPGAAVQTTMERRGVRGPFAIVYNVHGVPTSSANASFNPRLIEGWAQSTIVVYIGGLQPNLRGIEAQVGAVQAARERGADIKLLIAGFGNRAYCEKLLEPLSRQGAALMIDPLAQHEVGVLLEHCDVAISAEPVLFGAQSKFFECVVAGVRLIVADDGRDVSKIFSGFTLLFEGPDQLVERLLTAQRLSLGERTAARALVARLSAESNATLQKISSQLV